ncbi:MAG: DUF805 domain-containing protein [Xanthobacteraceae bacterium]
MTFGEAISSGFQNYVNFTGRASRSAFWYWFLFAVLLSIAASIIDQVAFSHSDITPISSLVGLALLLPGIAVTVRRLHDTDRSGWWVLLWFIPIIGWIILIIWYCARGTLGPNRFGPDPLAAVPS